jgi:hypothetical protein
VQTVEDYINACRILLQDTTPAPRYSDGDFQLALEISLDEAYRIRPDLFFDIPPVTIIGLPLSTEPPIPRGYQSAFMYYMCGHVQLRDAEETEDSRAGIFLNKFVMQLMQTVS